MGPLRPDVHRHMFLHVSGENDERGPRIFELTSLANNHRLYDDERDVRGVSTLFTKGRVPPKAPAWRATEVSPEVRHGTSSELKSCLLNRRL